jgi:4-amino-4-deoxy-L-arabinose transferase-like glycosyltransferase
VIGASARLDRETSWAIVAVLGFAALHLLAAAIVPLSPDETYYLSWSRFPAWSYYDHPPMVAWWVAAGTRLLGETPLGVRLFFVLSSIPTSWALYATGRLLFERRVAALAAIWINATLLVGVGGISATPDAPSVLFWALATLSFALVARMGNGAWWLAVGACAALGVASKLTDLFLGLGFLLALVAVADLRRWLRSPWLYAGVAVAALLFAPVFLWNAGHDWITFTKQFGRISSGRLEPLRFPEFLATQFLLLNPLIGCFVGLAVVAWLRRSPAYPVGAIGLLTWTVAPLVAYMAVHAFHGQIQGNWLAPIFPTLALVAAAAAISAPPERWRGGRALAFPLGAALAVLGLIGSANPGGIIPRALDPGQVLHGWEDVAHQVDAYRRETGAAWIGVDYYGMVGELQWRLGGTDTPVIGIVERRRYDYAPSPDASLAARPALIVTRSPLPAAVAACLTGLTQIGTIDRRSGSQTLQTLTVYRADGADPRIFMHGCSAAQMSGG